MNIDYEKLLELNTSDPPTLLKRKRGKKNKNKSKISKANIQATTAFQNKNSLYVHKFEETSHYKLFISKIKEVNFDTDTSLFVKGKVNTEPLDFEDTEAIPRLSSWQNRYYYFSRYDEGIRMDYESKT